MTIEGLINNIPLLIDLTIVAAYIIGSSAAIFGAYDILHLKWTGDLKAMITALVACTITLLICTVLKHGSIISNPMIIAYIYTTVTMLFYAEKKNPKLSHGAKPCNPKTS